MAGRLAGDVEVVLDRDGNTEQRPALARPQPSQRRTGFGQRCVGADGDERTQVHVESRNAAQIELGQLPRCELTPGEELRELRQSGESQVGVGVGSVSVGHWFRDRGHRNRLSVVRSTVGCQGASAAATWAVSSALRT